MVRNLLTKKGFVAVASIAALAMTMGTANAKPKKPTAAPACADARTISAAQLRIIQTELMVAGLSCRGIEQFSQRANTKRYNDFVTSYRPTLMDDAHKVLARYFRSEPRLNDYLTRLANDASQRSLANIGSFCDQASKIYDEVLAPAKVDLASYSAGQPFAGSYGLPVCASAAQAPVTAPVQPAAATRQQAPAVVPAVTQSPAPAMQTTPMKPITQRSNDGVQPAVTMAAATPAAQPAPALVASNNAVPVSSGVMRPVVEESRSPAVRRPVTPRQKPVVQ